MVRSASRTSTPAPGTLTQEIKFTPTPQDEPRDPEQQLSFWEQLYEIPDDQWAINGEKGFKVYLYEGPEGRGIPYIALMTQPFDIEWVKQNYGGGFYRATLNNPGGKIVGSIRFSIDGEPRRKPPTNAQAAGVPPQQPASMDSFQSQVLEIMRESTRRQEAMMERIMDRGGVGASANVAVPSAVDPTVMFRSMVEMFKEMMPAPAHQPMNLLETVALLDKLRGPDLLTVLTQAKTAGLIPAAGGGGNDLMGQLTGVIEVAEKIGLTSGKGGKSLGEAVIEKLPDILEAGGKAMEKYQTIENTRLATAREVRAIQQQQRGTVITPPPQPPAGQVTQHAGAQPYVDAAGPQTNATVHGSGLDVESPGATPTPEAIADAERQLIFIKGKIVEAIANGDSGGEIIDFLDKIDKTICDQFAGASAEQIAYFFSNDPVLKKAASLPRFKPAIAEMVEELNAPDEVLEATTKPN